MKLKNKLSANQLAKKIDSNEFLFETTDDLTVLDGVIGQSKATDVIQFGLQIHKPGYNMYVAGISGVGKSSFTHSIVKDVANKKAKLYDWIYVYNFSEPTKPRALQLPVGYGYQLKKDMSQFIHDLIIDLPKAFNDDNYQKERQLIIRNYNEQYNTVFNSLNTMAKKYGFVVRSSGSGILTIPIDENGEPMSEQTYRSLPDETLQSFSEKNEHLKEDMIEYTNELRKLEKEAKRAINNLDEKIVTTAIDYHLNDLQKRYLDCDSVLNYLEEVRSHIIRHREEFLADEKENNQAFTQLMQNSRKQDVLKKYDINLFVDHRHTQGAPVIIADNPTFYHLIGRVEYENQMGMMTTNFMNIKPGFLHAANGGYLIIQAKDILTNQFAWESLKRALLNEKVTIENIAEQTSLVATTSITPDPIPLNVKVILIGSLDIYHLLYYNDEEFKKLFKIKADFDIEMNATEENMINLARFIHTHCHKHQLLPFHRSAVANLIEYSMRLSGNQNKLSTRFNDQVDIIYEADTWAKLDQASLVKKHHVQKAIDKKDERNSLYKEKFLQSIDNELTLIDVVGEKIGQVNGLTVTQFGQFSFGKPVRITATTFTGKEGIINIERESNLSGNIHNKGIYILSGYLGKQFANDFPLALTAHITFEQTYGPIDGDSASSTELYALLSSLAQVPIKQSIAVTGSVNQYGDIQPIGGVNEKIEGYFEVCKRHGLTGNQAVIIPKQNKQQLMLKEEIINAVKCNQFHIYAIESIEEGLEILTGETAGKRDSNGQFKANTIFYKVYKKLEYFYKQVYKRA